MMRLHRRFKRFSVMLGRFTVLALGVAMVLGPTMLAALGQGAPSVTASQDDPGIQEAEEAVRQPPGGLGMLPSGADKQYLVRLPRSLSAAGQLPPSADLSGADLTLQAQPSSAGIPPVRNQGDTNTCTGWATSYYYKTYQEWRERGWSLATDDHVFSPSFVYNQVTALPDPDCNDGAMIPDALELIVSEGDLPLSQFSFNPNNCNVQPSPAQQSAALEYRGASDTSYGAFFISVGPPNGPEQNHYLLPLKQRLAGGDPFVLGFPIYSEFDYYQCNQVVGPPAYPATYRGLHAVAVVGYDDYYAGVGAFKIVNSYGLTWGCYGYAWLSYEFVHKYAWEAWWMEDNWAPWIAPHVPDRYSPNIGDSIMVDLTPYENDREDSGTGLKWYVEGADHCTISGQGSSNDVLFFDPNPIWYTGYDEITLVLRDSRGAEDRQQLMLGWFDLDINYYLPQGLHD